MVENYRGSWRLRIPLAGLVITTLALAAAAVFGADRNIRFHRHTPADGLSQEAVNCILQDRHGFMWFGTQEGLNRFDGYRFEIYDHDPDNKNSLGHPWVWTVQEDTEGIFWIGTEGGLDRYDQDNGTFVHFRHDPENLSSLSGNRVRVITEDVKGALWIGTFSNGLNRFDKATAKVTRFRHDESNPVSLSNDSVSCIYEDLDGELWIGTDGGGLNRLDPELGNFTGFRHDEADPLSLGHDRVRSICEGPDGNLWIGTYGGGISILDRREGVFRHLVHDPSDPGSLADNHVRCLFIDEKSSLWVSTERGLCGWRPYDRRFDTYAHDPTDPASLSDNRAISLYQDRGGVLWVGTYNGINRWNAVTGKFALYRQKQNATGESPNDVVWALHDDPDGSLWIGTWGGGLNRLDPQAETIHHFRKDPRDPGSLSDDRIMSLLVDKSGRLWVGTFGSGLDLFDRTTGTFSNYRNDPEDGRSLSGNLVTSICEDSVGRIWLGVFGGGVNILDQDTGTFTRFLHDKNDPTSLSSNRVLEIFEDSTGLMWIGTEDGGLNRYDPEAAAFIRYRHDPDEPTSLSSDASWSIQEDRDRNLWIGTQGGGFNRWDRVDRGIDHAVFKRYSKKDGLPSSVVYGILEDSKGYLWISTNRGLSRFDPDSEIIKNYDSMHGLQRNGFNFGAYHEGADGRMYFGGSHGVNAFHPHQIGGNKHVPPLVFTGFTKLNEPVDLGRPLHEIESIELTHRDYFVSFTFAALDYTAPEKNRYRYRMTGFSDRWIDLGTANRVTLTNLNPGKYELEVEGSNNDGIWNKQSLSLSIDVVPPPWKTWWAYSAYILGFAALVFGIFRSRVRGLKVKQQAVEQALAESQTLLKLLNRISDIQGVDQTVHETIARVIGEIGKHFTDLRIAYAVIDGSDVMTVLHSVEPSGMASLKGTERSVDFSAEYRTALTGRSSYVCADIDTDHRLDGMREPLLAEGVGAFIHVPVHHADEVQGLLRFEAPSARPWSGHEMINMIEASQYLTVVVKNAFIDSSRKEAAERTASSLREKETLLREIHHRVKNNLQVIYSLLNMQTDRLNDSTAINVFEVTQKRINSMAMIHDQLYHSDDLAWIDIREYARTLVDSLTHSYGIGEESVRIDLNVDDLRFDLDTAIPCGLILNELVSNAFKYAFPNGRKGRIEVSMHTNGDGRCVLKVADDGVGVSDDVDIVNTESMGMQLVHILTEQLEGEVALTKNPGTTFSISFPLAGGDSE